ncbi:MAG: HAD-IIA family hydrolase [Gammaproteobacteria bacterium]
MQSSALEIDMASLIQRYPCLLLDAYGVLLDKAGPLPGAGALIQYLNATGKPYYVLSNTASTLPQRMAQSLEDIGLPVPPQRLITSGLLLSPYFQRYGLVGGGCIVLGTEDSVAYVTQAGGTVVSPDTREPVDAVIIADQAGFPLLEALDDTLSVVLREFDRQAPLHLVLCNPDLIYPRSPGRFGFTAGGFAAMFESVLRERYPEQSHGFVRLGKPFQMMFEEAVVRAGTRDLVMIGDQLATDILGANRFGIDSVLVSTGLGSAARKIRRKGGILPNYVLSSLCLPQNL